METVPWFFRDPARLARERAVVEHLSHAVNWLVGHEWLLDSGLCLDAVIRAHGIDYELRVSFPSLYPEVPCAVRPRNQQQHLSGHQYGGPDGPLCLEWGPDNWHRDITAKEMLESAYRLLDLENPLGAQRGDRVIAPSRHQLTVGQELRPDRSRFYLTKPLKQFLSEQEARSYGSIRLSLRDLPEDMIVLVHEATASSGTTWRDPNIPKTIPGAGSSDLFSGIWVRADIDPNQVHEISTVQALSQLLEPIGGNVFHGELAESPLHAPIAGVLLTDSSAGAHLFVTFHGDKAYRWTTVYPTDDVPARAPSAVALGEQRIGIVGLGSAGSKVAASLVRMGVRRFLLVDHDILLPENLVRHGLDWCSVPLHKVDGVALALQNIAADCEVKVSRVHLTGQESNAVVSGVAQDLGECDAVVDATANPHVFNLLAAITRRSERTLVWLEVFGGGVGGLIARSRPRADPRALEMRGSFLRYCEQNPAPERLVRSRLYDLDPGNDGILTATDSDVAIIAHHAASLAVDCLTPGSSRYPHSMYLIGLSAEWVFREPFDTIPIDTSSLKAAEATGAGPAVLTQDDIDFLSGLIEKRRG